LEWSPLSQIRLDDALRIVQSVRSMLANREPEWDDPRTRRGSFDFDATPLRVLELVAAKRARFPAIPMSLMTDPGWVRCPECGGAPRTRWRALCRRWVCVHAPRDLAQVERGLGLEESPSAAGAR